MNILITGGTGLIGRRLTTFLNNHGIQVRLVSRSADKTAETPQFAWNVHQRSIDTAALEGVDAVIHLAGANIAEGRWTSKRKKEILDSRIRSTQLLFETIEKMEQKPSILICASATGYYGNKPFEHESSEDDTAGNNFLAKVCEDWEQEADRFTTIGMRVVKVRTGVVLDQEGGALPKITLPIRLFAGTSLGSGKQYISWVHWEDWCQSILHFLVNQELSGAYNLVAPNPVTNAQLTRLIARTIHRPLWLPNAPQFMLKLMLGEMSSVLLEGHKISSTKLEKSDFKFKFESAEQAISQLLGQQ